jgi:hypothetical protein
LIINILGSIYIYHSHNMGVIMRVTQKFDDLIWRS